MRQLPIHRWPSSGGTSGKTLSVSVFWLAAPSDCLETLYSGAIGGLQRLQLEGPLVRQVLAKDEQRWFDQLVHQLAVPEQKARQHNLLLAVIPYTRPGQFRWAIRSRSCPIG